MGTVSVMGRQSGSIFSRRISGLFRISAANLDTNLTDENMCVLTALRHPRSRSPPWRAHDGKERLLIGPSVRCCHHLCMYRVFP